MNGDLMSGDVLQDPIVGRGRAANIVLRLQPIDRHDNRQAIDGAELRWNLADSARHELNVDAARRQDRQQRLKFAIAHEGFAADDRQVERLEAIDDTEHAVDERLAFEIAHLAERHAAAEMFVVIRVAAGTAERTLAGDLDGKSRRVTGEDPTPGAKYPFGRVHRSTIT